MAIKQRSVLSTQNTTLSTNKDTAFPDNNNKEITAADLRTWLDELLSQVQDILDSYFNKLDELRIASTLSYDIVSTPSDWNGGTAPATQNLVNDELAERLKAFETNNLSDNIAYVATTGVDVLGELGNEGKPFATITAAWNACPSSNFIIKVLGGTYTEEVDLFGKSNFMIDLSGTTLNATGVGFRLLGCNNGFVSKTANTINGNCNFGGAGSSRIGVNGGNINGLLNLGEDAFVSECIIVNSGICLTTEVSLNSQRPYITNCKIENTASGYTITAIGVFNNCNIKGTQAIQVSSSSVFYSEFTNCTITGNGTTGASTLIGNGSGVFNAKFTKCTIESFVERPIWIGNVGSNYILFDDCRITSAKDCVLFQSTLNRLSATRTTFQDCRFYLKDTVTYEVFTGNPNASDLGKTQLIDCFTNKAFTVLTNFEELGTTTLVADAQIF
jgi:hypothetical protein